VPFTIVVCTPDEGTTAESASPVAAPPVDVELARADVQADSGSEMNTSAGRPTASTPAVAQARHFAGTDVINRMASSSARA